MNRFLKKLIFVFACFVITKIYFVKSVKHEKRNERHHRFYYIRTHVKKNDKTKKEKINVPISNKININNNKTNIYFIKKNQFLLLNTPNKNSELVYKNSEQSGKNYILNNKFLSRDLEGIQIFPTKQKNEDDEQNLKTLLPSREFKPKRSLGQNYLKDENIIKKMIQAIELDSSQFVLMKEKKKKKNLLKSKKDKIQDETDEKNKLKINENNCNSKNMESLKNEGKGIIELGCGLGQLSKHLFKKYKNMTAIEIDSRALTIISRTMPGFDFIHDDVLQINYKELSINKNTKLSVIGNLPFYITSQILFCLLDFYKYIEQAVVTIQYEVGQRIVAKQNDKDYSILSILFSLYTHPYLLFKIPSNAFYPIPKVEAAVMKIIFKKHNFNCNLLFLKQVLKHAFQQRRKKLKSSLKGLLNMYNIQNLPMAFSDLRPQQLYPEQFVELTNILFPLHDYPFDPNVQTKVWRKTKHGE
ncbi:apicoplast dimethyladenosine synthase, putative [Plasmodium berghei]|uniref:rRNA adenine N(6)-methyltransferase n=2 Tax=Plasmodium berghei TaxID=5821 RepID=A0A509AVT8_PLABA|nr:ribosomal RNA small subunit methyltransferase A2, putative [Plasmodium berghei ANKA]CXJ29451.1 apicoplast dimethyladenosine synthase, putative [Plasmodium berghei]SCM27083.1 apicoplast dimethyladenosine synthase, putative [Plasmodium berghei]SCN28809.1 apicoplast dimethyladenosine synthase, putative [Plasmodium berghei]SCO63106.1 apicoplast dimethyladenosine synthase, putative [Plasmodium berghei]SCO64556.1 apicoplast dimethyladenosine synthase, putative [Plasmodium berghei]|eukprot:XP_034424455.1 ribosomal RNA small subunit methyltransferase A2, putative [Plasmodium berghei ANKA]